MKQLLFITYAAHIKVSPRTHDIKESMLHSNLGHNLPSEKASRMLKQMENPMNQKPPQLGFEQRSLKQPRICMNATAPFPPPHLRPSLRLCPEQHLEEGWGGKVKHGSSTTLQYKQLKEAELYPSSQRLLKKPMAPGLNQTASGFFWCVLIGTSGFSGPQNLPRAPASSFTLGSAGVDSAGSGRFRLRTASWEEAGLYGTSKSLFSNASSIAPLLSFPSVSSRLGPVLVKYLCYP